MLQLTVAWVSKLHLTAKLPINGFWQEKDIEALDPETESSNALANLQAGFCQINPVTKIGQRLYMIHMLLLPFLPIRWVRVILYIIKWLLMATWYYSALIIQNAITLKDLLQYQQEVQRSGAKVDGATHLEKFITNMQRERSEASNHWHANLLYIIFNCYLFQVAFYIFTYGKQTLGLNLSERFAITDEVNWAMPTMYWITPNMQLLIVTAIKHIFVSNKALENMPWPEMRVSESQENMFKSKLRFQIRHGDFRQRISQDEEDINSILNW